MQTLTKCIITTNLREFILNESLLARILGGSAQRRYNLITHALMHN
ncbi:hypothetical protein Thiowin_01279 [Thiorhodovibrio winogradskyi]|uniref:Uncharacterized protein n=1 Tax=Thiorhodovibrio winogradskyi TaxID=77007 RepID=A0ABZ0S5M0_9GAMM|nr:hypothetical protein [Thiorhodovibrio winogradskyi]